MLIKSSFLKFLLTFFAGYNFNSIFFNQIIFISILAAIMTFVMTFFVTYSNLGFVDNFIFKWLYNNHKVHHLIKGENKFRSFSDFNKEL